jgi:3-methyladenine DNA glycosylase AlkC
VPRYVLDALEAGAESANHMEQIALDMGVLLTNHVPILADRADELRERGLVSRMRRGGELLFEEFGSGAPLAALAWKSDTLRGFGAMAVGVIPELTLRDRLQLIEPFADDPHFAVREWAWLSLRPHVSEAIRSALKELLPWALEESPRLRRFACEVTRPRGVWSRHLPELKAEPEIAMPLLDSLRADEARYVQNSLANWLNDASKSRPDWAKRVCAQWMIGTPSAATQRICRRALRSLPQN